MYTLTTFCDSQKFEIILPLWEEQIKKTCTNYNLNIIRFTEKHLIDQKYGWWDVIRMRGIIAELEKNNIAVQCDLDIIIKKDIQELIDLDYDFIIAQEINENKAFPQECSSILGFGVCTGFYIAKPNSLSFLKNILNDMQKDTYNTNSYSDQVNIMHTLVKNDITVEYKKIILDNIEYENKIISFNDIKICVLNFEIIRRDPITDKNHYAMHVNINSVGGVFNFLKYFTEDFDSLLYTRSYIK